MPSLWSENNTRGCSLCKNERLLREMLLQWQDKILGGIFMAIGILGMSASGGGKTTSCRTLNPKETLIINADNKPLPWKGWRKQYNAENKNYICCADAKQIQGYLKTISDSMPHIKNVVIDTLNGVMLAMEMAERKANTYSDWKELAVNIYGLCDMIGSLREDLNVICFAHTQTDMTDSGYMFTHMRTSGRKLEKIVIESKFTYVLLGKGNQGKYIFETHANNSTAKTPMGLFEEDEIDNDMQMVINKIREYEEG
jgi:hypothetical protein